ncbi:MAG: LysR family transcriptional regulator [Aliishimia sp.]
MNESERLPIDSDLLLTFMRIAECGNLTIAAGQLGRTQSAISVQLRKLEMGLGTTLFIRSGKGMVLTSAGETLLSRAKLIVAEIRETAKLFRQPLTGSIRVGLPDDFDEVILERILLVFSRTHPGVQVLARSGCTAGYAAAIETGDLDIAVCSGLDDPGGDPLNTEEIVWAAREGMIWPDTETVPLAVLDRPCYWRDLPKQLLDAHGRKHRIAFQSGSFTSLQAALRAGVAIGLLPKSSVGDGLQILAESDGLPSLPISHRSILISKTASEQIATAMVEAIRNASNR